MARWIHGPPGVLPVRARRRGPRGGWSSRATPEVISGDLNNSEGGPLGAFQGAALTARRSHDRRVAIPGVPRDIGGGEPRDDGADAPGVEDIEGAATVEGGRASDEEAGLREESQLARRGRSGDTEQLRDGRRASRVPGAERDDPATRGIGQKGDAGSVPAWHPLSVTAAAWRARIADSPATQRAGIWSSFPATATRSSGIRAASSPREICDSE